MAEISIPMKEVTECLICKKWIGKGNDPAVCDNPRCVQVFEVECEFNKFAKKEAEIDYNPSR